MLKEKVAVVTGGSRGIGAATVKKLASMGADVVILDVGNLDKANEVKEEVIASFGVKAGVYACNVTDYEACDQTVKQIIADFGGIDILVNNAGITRDGLLVTMPEQDFDDVINTNLKGCFHLIKACGRNFIRRKYGKIINVSSVSAFVGTAGQVNYASSKAGVVALTKVTAREFGGKNVCCNAVAPGFIVTDMTAELQNEEYLKSIPLKRLGKPEDVANVIGFLASPMADYVTGEVIRVDGGMAM